MNGNLWAISKFYAGKTVVLDKSITCSLEEGDVLREFPTISGGATSKRGEGISMRGQLNISGPRPTDASDKPARISGREIGCGLLVGNFRMWRP
jgi:hypothetical protein